MSKTYKLIDAVDVPQTFWIPHTTKSGMKYEYVKMLPGKEYEEYIDDDVFMTALLDAHEKMDYTPERKAALDACGARYKETKCVPCNGGRKRLDVWFVEVVE